MPIPDELRQIDVYKEPLYKLCDFLIKKRRSLKDMGRIRSPLSFPVSELSELFEYVHDVNTNPEKIEKIKEKLMVLNTEPVSENENRTIIHIVNPQILDNFSANFTAHLPIQITCTSEDLSNYEMELKRRTEAMKRALGAVTVIPTTHGGAIVRSGESDMEVRAKNATHPIGPRLLLLLSGANVPLSGLNPSIRSFCRDCGEAGYEDYEIGHAVGIDFLQKIFSYMEHGGTWRDQQPFPRKKIRDSLHDMNEKALSEEHFGDKIFLIEDDSVTWVL